MPIKPPNLDDRRYADIVAEARALIPQYCPEWTNLSDADPGITLVQLFAWMTELTIYRLNRVPDNTYIHFLNFIGEERKRARPSVAPLTFLSRGGRAIELPAFARCATRQREDNQALDFVTTDRLTVHDSAIVRVMAVRGGRNRAVREVPFSNFDGHPSSITFSGGRGVQLFDLDPVEYGPDSFTPHQFLYVAHNDLRLMDFDPEDGRTVGRMRVRRSSDELSVAAFFEWEYPSGQGWTPFGTEAEEDAQLGMVEQSLVTALPGLVPIPFEIGDAVMPEPIQAAQWWVRGRLDFERWLSNQMTEDLEVVWKDDRGGEERPVNNVEVRHRGRTLEFFLGDLPPIKGGWTIGLSMVDRGVRAGRNRMLPDYRWYFRRGDAWEEIAADQVRMDTSSVTLIGPLPDMASDGFNLRAERIQTVFLNNLVPNLELDLNWIRPVEQHLFAGDDVRRADSLLPGEGPYSPFQMSPIIPPTIGRKLYIGSDLFENRRQEPVTMELEIGFETNGELIEEPEDLYALQMTYRAEDSWRVVWTKDKRFSKFTFSVLDKDGAKRAARRRIRVTLNPKTQLKGLARFEMNKVETTWLRIELIKSSLTAKDENEEQHPIAIRLFGIRLAADKTLADDTYEQPMPASRVAQLDFREQNQRLTRVVTQATGRLSEFYPFFGFVEIEEENQSLYLQFDKPLPVGNRHAIQVRCRGEAFLPEGVGVEWEMLEGRDHGRTGWRRLQTFSEGPGDAERRPYDLSSSGVLEFPLPELPVEARDGFWLRGRFTLPPDRGVEVLPPLPPITHVMLNTVDAASLYTVRTERYSGRGVPSQVIQLLRKPLFLHPGEAERPVFTRPELFTDVRVLVEDEKGAETEWRQVDRDALLIASKDEQVYVVDPVEGTLTFGNGIRGRMLPVGSNNVTVDTYRVVPGSRGNVGPHEISVCETYGDSLEVTNLLPATGGRDAESIDEIITRAPSVLTSRDRAVTRADFEIIAKEASGEVARAACNGRMDEDGKVEIVVLPLRREGEEVPDPFLSAGLRDHVSRYLKRRCLINVDPVVRLARFQRIDVSVELRLRPNSNVIQVREAAETWIKRFLDPYNGGLDGEGWPFGGTLYAQDFARMVTDIAEVRHVVAVDLYDQSGADPAAPPRWAEGAGSSELLLTEHDLFVVRKVRVRAEEVGE